MRRTCADCGSPEVSYIHADEWVVCTLHRCPDCVPIGVKSD